MRMVASCTEVGHPVVSLLASELIALMRQADGECADSITIKLLDEGFSLELVERASQLSDPFSAGPFEVGSRITSPEYEASNRDAAGSI